MYFDFVKSLNQQISFGCAAEKSTCARFDVDRSTEFTKIWSQERKFTLHAECCACSMEKKLRENQNNRRDHSFIVVDVVFLLCLFRVFFIPFVRCCSVSLSTKFAHAASTQVIIMLRSIDLPATNLLAHLSLFLLCVCSLISYSLVLVLSVSQAPPQNR